MNIMEITDLYVGFPTKDGVVKAVNTIDLTIEEGENIGILGESGSGKSVFANSILRLIKDQADIEGTVLYRGKNLMKMDKKDDYTIEITTKEPYGALKEKFCEYKTAIVSTKNDFKTTLIGTGPFKFKETQKDVKNVVERNDEYWGGEVNLAGAEFYPGEDEMTRCFQLYNNEIDFSILNIPITEYDNAKSHDQLDVFTLDCDYTHIMVLNTTKAPFDNKDVRHAISYAIDREQLVDSLYGNVEGGIPSYGVVPEKYSWYNPDSRTTGYDKDKALELFKSAGIEDTNGDGMLEYKGSPFKVTIMTYDTGFYKNAVEILQSQLKAVGVDVQLEITTWDDTDQKMSNKNYDINFDSVPFLEFGNPSSLADKFDSNSYFALGAGYSSKKMDKLLKEGSKALDEKTRKEKYDKVQEIAMDDMPFIPVFEVVKVYAMNKRLHNMDLNTYSVFKITKDTYIQD